MMTTKEQVLTVASNKQDAPTIAGDVENSFTTIKEGKSVDTSDNSTSTVSSEVTAVARNKQRRILYSILFGVSFVALAAIVSWLGVVKHRQENPGHHKKGPRPLVFGNVLTNEEIESIIWTEEQIISNATRIYKDNKIISRVPLNETIIQRLSTHHYESWETSETSEGKTVVGDECTNRIFDDDGINFSGAVAAAFSKVLQGHTPRHVDWYDDGPKKGTRVSGSRKVGYIVLNDNPTATFIHGDNHIPLAKSNLVVFDGTTEHNTVVKEGTVSLLGPFDMSEGGCFYPIRVGK